MRAFATRVTTRLARTTAAAAARSTAAARPTRPAIAATRVQARGASALALRVGVAHGAGVTRALHVASGAAAAAAAFAAATIDTTHVDAATNTVTAADAREDPVSIADQLYAAERYADELSVLEAAFASAEAATGGATSDIELLWRLARARKNVADRSSDEMLKRRLRESGLAVARRALALDTLRWESHYWTGILLSLVSDYSSTTEQLKAAFVMREHFDRALALNPAPKGTNFYVIGMWCFTFADMGWVSRNAAAMLFATPPTSSYVEALGFFERAEAAEPGFYVRNAVMAGKTLLRMGQRDKALVWLNKALAMESKYPEDEAAKAEARQLIQ